MEKEKTQLEKAFDLFYTKDELRPKISSPFEADGYVVASNGHVLIRVRKNRVDFEYDASNKGPDMTGIIPEYNRNSLLQLNKQFFDVYKTVDEYEDVIKNVECYKCRGKRVVEWTHESYKKLSACPICSGKGFHEKTVSEKTGKRLFNYQVIKIENSYFLMRAFYIIFSVQELVGGDIVLVSLGDDNSKGMFKIGDCEVLIMPFLYSPENNWELIDITHKLKR